MWAKTLILAAANTNYNLLALMVAADPNAPNAFAQLSVQLDVGAGGARLYIGNPTTLSGTNRGDELIASQTKNWGPFNMNIISPGDVWVRTNTGGEIQINVEGWTI